MERFILRSFRVESESSQGPILHPSRPQPLGDPQRTLAVRERASASSGKSPRVGKARVMAKGLGFGIG